MNRSFRAQDPQLQMQAAVAKQRQQLRASMMKDKEEELALFLEMKKRENEQLQQSDLVLLNEISEFDAPLGSMPGTSPIFNITSSTPARKTGGDDFLNSESDKSDYDWLITPPGTPLFPSLEMESQRTVMSQIGTPKASSTVLKSRLANSQTESISGSSLLSRQSASSPGLNSSGSGVRRPSSSSSSGLGSRPATPAGRSPLTTASKPSRSSTPTSRASLSSSKPTVSATRSSSSAVKSVGPPARSTASAVKPAVTARSSTPTRSTGRSLTPASSIMRSSTSASSIMRSSTSASSIMRSSTSASSIMRSSTSASSTARSSNPASSTVRSPAPTSSTMRSSTPVRSTARSSTPTTRTSIPPPSKSASRPATPTRRPSTPSMSAPPIKSSLSIPKSAPTVSRNPVASRGSSPAPKSRSWKPSEMPGYSLDAPPNLRTSLPDRPISASRGRPGAPSSRSSSIEPVSNGRIRRQSCSPSRGRAPNGSSSVPAVNRLHAKCNESVNPVVVGTKMVERVINMRKLAPPRLDDKHSPHGNLSVKSSSSPDSSGFGRSLSKKSLDMAIRHMDIRRSVPGNLRPLMTNIPASSMYSVRSGPARSRTISVSDSPLATSSNASSELSVSNIGISFDGIELGDEIRHGRSPIRGR